MPALYWLLRMSLSARNSCCFGQVGTDVVPRGIIVKLGLSARLYSTQFKKNMEITSLLPASRPRQPEYRQQKEIKRCAVGTRGVYIANTSPLFSRCLVQTCLRSVDTFFLHTKITANAGRIPSFDHLSSKLVFECP